MFRYNEWVKADLKEMNLNNTVIKMSHNRKNKIFSLNQTHSESTILKIIGRNNFQV